ncbi:MAG TPA: ice-binding family protein, partial [Armatimonadota bacterium]|nr:ice-binding family protein [Armatimonadota bacterium]
GQVAGFQQIAEASGGVSLRQYQPFVWDAANGLSLLERVPGTGGRPLANNASGEVLGLTLAANTASPVSWSPTGIRNLDEVNYLAGAGPFRQELGGINAAGQIVYSLFTTEPGSSTAVLHQDGAAADLNNLVDRGADVRLCTASGINESGQIVGAMLSNRGARLSAYLLTPAPSPQLGARAFPELPVNLGTAGNYTILAQAGISTTGPTSINGDIAVSPIAATAITGFALILDSTGQFSRSDVVTGKVYAADYANPTPSLLTTAVGDMLTAYNDAAGRTNPDATELNSGNIGGLTFTPGLYKWSSGVTITSDITLSGNSSDVWIFQVAGTLNISSGKQVRLSGGAQAKNVFWQVAGQTTLGTTSVFNGIILGKTAIVAQTGATLNGRALAQTAVTLDSNRINGVPPAVPPTIRCPADVSVRTDAGRCTASGVQLGTPTTTGTGVVVTNNAPTVFPLGVTLVTWTAVDSNGVMVSCAQRVTVTDQEAPRITCPADVTVPVDARQSTASGVALGTPVVTDNCPGATSTGTRSDGQPLTGPYPTGTTTVTWTATDAAGNMASCPQQVVVVPAVLPTIQCPADVSVRTDTGRCTASGVRLGTPTTTGLGVVVSNNAPAAFPLGATVVTWTAVDSNGVMVSCAQRVTVTDQEVPRITCPADVTVREDAGQPMASGVALGRPVVTDNCSGATSAGARSDR